MTATTASVKTPSKADLKAAAELDAMADAVDPQVSWEQSQELDDIEFGKVCAASGAVLQLRKRAAELRQDPNARYM